ncbi:hypothetical protein ASZ88_00129 [Vibrio cholerae]|nr:hypothetical protein ASZ88_00129 [Vibrio cholerae]GHZ42300.1 helicase [Vibrio cholerae]
MQDKKLLGEELSPKSTINASTDRGRDRTLLMKFE